MKINEYVIFTDYVFRKHDDSGDRADEEDELVFFLFNIKTTCNCDCTYI